MHLHPPQALGIRIEVNRNEGIRTEVNRNEGESKSLQGWILVFMIMSFYWYSYF